MSLRPTHFQNTHQIPNLEMRRAAVWCYLLRLKPKNTIIASSHRALRVHEHGAKTSLSKKNGMCPRED